MTDLFDKIAELGGDWNDKSEQFEMDSPADPCKLGRRMHDLVCELYPLNRSITGDGVRKSFDIISRVCDIEKLEIPSGTRVFDWTVPQEWVVRDAYVKDSSGKRVIDLADSNLHLVGYSDPVKKIVSLGELKNHLHTLPENPDWIPYRTMYYTDGWGFCVSHKHLQSFSPGDYEVCVDTEKIDGSLSYAEFRIEGDIEDEILFFAHCCHPSLGNDNLSGNAVAAFLGSVLRECRLRHSIRIVFAPATIGSIAWLATHESEISNIKAGYVLSVLGDNGHFRIKKARRANSMAELAAEHALRHCGERYEMVDFNPWGYDERQFCSPGIDLPVVRLTRTPNGEYPEYHTSADDLDLVKPTSLLRSLLVCLRIVAAIDSNRTYKNMSPKGEPQLGRRGLYREMGGFQNIETVTHAMLWLLNQSDGDMPLLAIAEKSGMSCDVLHQAARLLHKNNLLSISC